MKILKLRIYIDLLIGLCSILIGLWLIAIMVIGLVSFFERYGFVFGSIFSVIGIILTIPFIGFIYLFLSFLKPQAKMLNLSISIDNTGGLIIINPPSEFIIQKNDIMHILKKNMTIVIVWSSGNNRNLVKTFFIRKQYFPREEYIKFVNKLSTYKCFSSDVKENKNISAKYGLDHIFRKNKLENEF